MGLVEFVLKSQKIELGKYDIKKADFDFRKQEGLYFSSRRRLMTKKRHIKLSRSYGKYYLVRKQF